jgi:hypothetical protein
LACVTTTVKYPVAKMFDYTNLHEVFAEGLANPYDRETQRDIEHSRKTFDGALFIDRVLRAVGITKGKFVARADCDLLTCDCS